MPTTLPARAPGAAFTSCTNPLLAALNREWQDRYERRHRLAPPGWATSPALARYPYPVDALAALEAAATGVEQREAILAALADLAATGDTQAARVVVQYLLPSLLHDLTRPRGASVRNRDETVADLVGAAWLTVAEGVDRAGRPTKVALLRRIEHRALTHPRKLARRQAEREVPGDPPVSISGSADLFGRPAHRGPSAEEEVLELLGDAARAGLDPADVRCLAQLTVGRLTPAALAVAEGVTDRSIRNRRAGAIRRLAALAA